MRSTNLPAEADLLKRVTVRLIDPHEREEFDRRLEADHYLGKCALYGPSLRYVAELDGQYVALIAFGVAALHLKARDSWIGWSPRQRARRLGLVANNSRFLVLPEREKLPNLASRVLGLVLRQLSDDWLKLHGKPILVVETFDTEEEAIRVANDTPYGLSSYVFGDTHEHANKVGRRIRAGNVHLNGASLDVCGSFGGYKQSGLGREWGAFGFEEFLEVKSVFGADASAKAGLAEMPG